MTATEHRKNRKRASMKYFRPSKSILKKGAASQDYSVKMEVVRAIRTKSGSVARGYYVSHSRRVGQGEQA